MSHANTSDHDNTENHEPRKHRHTKPWPKIVAALVALLLIATVTFLIVRNLTSPITLVKVETTNSLSSRVTDAEIKTSFAPSEPIILHLEYRGAPIGKAIRYELKNSQNETVKTGSTTILRSTETDPTEGQRSISIANAGTESLPAGEYSIILSIDDHRIHTQSFKIE